MKRSYWWNVELFACNVEGLVGSQRPQNFWLENAVMSPCILCKIQKPKIVIFVARSATEAFITTISNWTKERKLGGGGILGSDFVGRFARSFTERFLKKSCFWLYLFNFLLFVCTFHALSNSEARYFAGNESFLFVSQRQGHGPADKQPRTA